MGATVTGMPQVLRNIQREMMAVRGRTYKGMYLAMKHLEEQMDTVSPMVPIDTQEMRDSWFISGDNHPTNPIMFAGYTVPYAPIVHEAWHVKHWTRAGSGPKWLQIHFARSIMDMKLIIARNAYIPVAGRSSAATSFTPITSRTNERNVEF